MNSASHRPLWARLPLYAAVTVTVAFALIPLIWIVLTSFKKDIDVNAFPPKFIFSPTLKNYTELLLDGTDSILLPFYNSLVITIVSTGISLAVASLAGYSLSRLKPRGSTLWVLFILGVRMLPPIVLVTPMFQIMNRLGLMDTQLALIVPYTALSIPLAVWIMYSFFIDLPKELEEAAIVDGCTRLDAFLKIILPLAAPGMAATAIFSFTLSWNDLEFALPLTTFNATTLPVIASRVAAEEGILWGHLGTVASVMIIPVALFTFLVQKHIVKALTAGVGK